MKKIFLKKLPRTLKFTILSIYHVWNNKYITAASRPLPLSLRLSVGCLVPVLCALCSPVIYSCDQKKICTALSESPFTMLCVQLSY